MGFLDGLIEDPEIRGGLGTSIGALGLALASSPGDAPLANLPQAMAIMGQQQKAGTSRSALKALLMQAGYNEAEANQLSSSEGVAKLAIDQKREQGFDKLVTGAFSGGGGPSVANLGIGASPTAKPPSMAGGGQTMAMPSGDTAEIQGKFTDALKAGGLTNPYGLGAMTAYGQHESRYSPGNIAGTWSDPSESGQAGTSGGILSWRAGRLANMQAATAGAKDPVAAQAKFALAENPELTMALQNAKSAEEANGLMANAWKFAGYDRQGGEFANRLATTRAYASRFGADGGGGAPTQVASADTGSLPPGMASDAGSDKRPAWARPVGSEAGAYGMPGGATRAPAQTANASQADMPASGSKDAEFYIPGSEPAAPGTKTAAAQQTYARNKVQAEVNNTLALMARTGMYGDRGKALAEALKQKIAPLQKYLEPTDIERTLAAAEAASPEAAVVIRNSIADQRPAEIQKFEYGNKTPGFEDYQKRMAEAGRSQVNIDQRKEGKFEEGMGTASAKRFSDYIESADKARGRMSDINVLRDASRSLGSLGSSANARAVLGPYLESVGVPVKGLDDIQLFKSTVDRLAPQLREAGAGATSDRDLAGFQNSIGSLSNTPKAREMILDVMEAASRNQMEVGRIARQVSTGKLTRDAAEEQIGNLPDPLTSYRSYRKANPETGEMPKPGGERQDAPRGQGALDAPQSAPRKLEAPPASLNTTERAVSIQNAKAAISRNPAIRQQVIERMKAAGVPTEGL